MGMGESVRLNDQTLHWNASHTQMGAKKQANEKCRFIGRFSMSFCSPDMDESWFLNDKSTI